MKNWHDRTKRCLLLDTNNSQSLRAENSEYHREIIVVIVVTQSVIVPLSRKGGQKESYVCRLARSIRQITASTNL